MAPLGYSPNSPIDKTALLMTSQVTFTELHPIPTFANHSHCHRSGRDTLWMSTFSTPTVHRSANRAIDGLEAHYSTTFPAESAQVPSLRFLWGRKISPRETAQNHVLAPVRRPARNIAARTIQKVWGLFWFPGWVGFRC
ncbi:hypothetical protein AVEN_184761-1 [Araneus ventricosus]|uniref:Uncharacterized protein n=1 Tax=Araneus ventricosus TaxID=182803 RepID=A0A4Y2KY58_ARAVE|nr:hypothetical protein AVEN_184761-1 [Araneus ventricosus]